MHWWGEEQRLANSLVDRFNLLLEGERERDKRVDETIWWVSASNQGPTAVRIASRAARADEGCSVIALDKQFFISHLKKLSTIISSAALLLNTLTFYSQCL